MLPNALWGQNMLRNGRQDMNVAVKLLNVHCCSNPAVPPSYSLHRPQASRLHVISGSPVAQSWILREQEGVLEQI